METRPAPYDYLQLRKTFEGEKTKDLWMWVTSSVTVGYVDGKPTAHRSILAMHRSRFHIDAPRPTQLLFRGQDAPLSKIVPCLFPRQVT